MTTTEAPAAPAPKRQRGRETAGDMIRSLGLIMLVVVPLWFFAQPPSGDEQAIRVVDPSADVASLRAAVPGVVAPTAVPTGWKPTSSTLEPGALRIGYVIPGDDYAEYAASTAPAPTFLDDLTGGGRKVGTFVVEGVSWDQYRDGGDHDSLVRSAGGATVVVGGVRETATLDQLRQLAVVVR